jgi:hypothetical protein
MSLQRQGQDSAALDLHENCIYMARDGTVRSHPKGAEFFRKSGRSLEWADGRTLALHHVRGPQDVHYPVWEMHPEGDELLILTSGSLSVEFRDGEAERPAPLLPQTAFIVRAGIWHPLIVHEPSVLIAITPRHNTVHEPSEAPTRARATLAPITPDSGASQLPRSESD